MIAAITLALCGVLGLGALSALTYTLARIAGLTDRRAPRPLPSPSTPAPVRPLDASEIRARILAQSWHREGRLSPAGYVRLCELMYSGQDVYPYWSGGELHGAAVVWDGTRGRAGERLTVEEWNADAEHMAGAHLDPLPAPSSSTPGLGGAA